MNPESVDSSTGPGKVQLLTVSAVRLHKNVEDPLTKIRAAAALLLFTMSVSLLALNVFGLTSSIRMEGLDTVDSSLVRFRNDGYMSYRQSIKQLDSIAELATTAYAIDATKIVRNSLTHVRWKSVDAREFRQLIPAWENYFLFLVGSFSGLPQFERYHFVDLNRSLERGIGICGDASMVMSQLLDRKNIKNEIVSFDGHVINQATLDNGKQILLDADFGVVMDFDLETLIRDPDKAASFYENEGFREWEVRALLRIYRTPHATFDNVYAFMPKRYIFEYSTYVLKWLLPLGMLIAAVFFLSGTFLRQ